MGKGNGSTRASSSGSPRGLVTNIVINGQRYPDMTEREFMERFTAPSETEREIADYENGIEELRAQQQELFDEEDRLGREMARDPENQEYYENQIMDLDREIDEIDHEIQTYRIRIDRLRRTNNR